MLWLKGENKMKRKYCFIMLLLSIMFLSTGKKLMADANDLIYKEVVATPGDTSTELQYLLDFNKDGKYNLIVIIPEGEYLLNKEMRIYSNTSIQADKNAKLLKNHQRGAMIANDLSNDKGGYATTENITISGGIWDSSRIAELNKGTESLRFIHTTNVTIKNATICNVPDGSHMITLAGVANGTIKNCTLYGYNGSMLKEAIQLDIVHDNVIVPSMQEKYLTYDDLACDNILITGCNIYNYSRAIGSHTSVKGVFHKNITIQNNMLHELQDTAIKAYNYINLKVSDNTIYNASMGILVYTYIKNEGKHYLDALETTNQVSLPKDYNITIKNNIIYNIAEANSSKTATWGDAIRTIGVSSRPLSGVTIFNNTIKNVKRYGIFLEGTTTSNISRNDISDTTNSGIYLISGSHNAKIAYNTLQKIGLLNQNSGGIGLNESKKATIINNTLTPLVRMVFSYIIKATKQK
ncbi:MAG: Parallel beta-helix repeat [Anaerocolumna sp.]|nr:Parallel beta-helix repeat [Anaerocolumna sp.]